MVAAVEDEFEQMGERLARARTSAGMSVEDVVFQTRIPKSVVLALEAGDFTVFSSPTYAKSFLAQYSSLLKVDASIWINALEPASFVVGDSMPPLWVPANREWMGKKPERDTTSGWVAAVSVIAVSSLLVYGAVQGYRMMEERFAKESAEPAAAEIPPPATTDIRPAATAPPAAAPVADEAAAAAEEEQAPRARVVRNPDL